MSTLFYSTTKRALAPIVKPLGFRCKGRFYHRIIDNVVQQFCLLWLNHDFTIRFHISSVFGDNDKHIEGSEIAKLIDGSNNMWLGQRMVKSELQQQFSLQGPSANLFPNYNECANTCVDMLVNYLFRGLMERTPLLLPTKWRKKRTFSIPFGKSTTHTSASVFC